MKKNFMLRMFALLGAIALCSGLLTACSDSNTDEPIVDLKGKLSVTLTKGAAGYYELNFTVTPVNAVACAYAWAKADAALPTAAEILASGTQVAQLTGSSSQKISGLEQGTPYRIVAAVKGADGATALSDVLEMATTGTSTGSLDDLKLNYLSWAEYTFNSDTEVANYVVTICSARPDSNGDPAAVGDVMIVLDLYGEMAADISDIHLPSGTYEMSAEEGVAWTWTNAHSGMYRRDADGVSLSPMLGGTVTVKEEAGAYTITVASVLLSGEEIKATFEGRIPFMFSGSSNYGAFTEPQNVVFENYSQHSCRYYGNWYLPHADDMDITFYTGEMSGEDYQSEGYKLSLSPYMHKQSNYNLDPMPLEEGVYTVKAATSQLTTAIPMTLDPGRIIDFLGSRYISDTYLSYIDGKTGMRKLALITAGTMTVARTGDNYKFEFDFVAENGITVTGSYQGEFRMKNYNDADTSIQFPLPERPLSTLTSDVALAFAPGTTCVAFYMGSYLYPDYDSWMIWINYDPNTEAPVAGHYLATEILVPKNLGGTVIPAGTYTMGWEPGAYVAFPGFQIHDGSVLYSWFADFSRVDSEGNPYDIAPVDSGSFSVEKNGNDYKIVMNLTDDAGHAIRGEWNGPILIADITESAAAAQTPKVKLHR